MNNKCHRFQTVSGLLWCLFLLLLFCGNATAQSLKLVLPIGHTDKISSAKFSPDGKKVLTASADKTAKLWDAATGYLLADLKGHEAEVDFSEFSPDGKKIVTGATNFYADNDSTRIRYYLWDGQTGNAITTLPVLRTSIIRPPLFSSNSSMLLMVSDSARFWDIEKGTIATVFKTGTDDFNPLAVSPDGKYIVSTDAFPYSDTKNPKLKIWDAVTGKLIKELTGHSAFIKLIRFTPDRQKMITVSMKETLVWDIASWKLVQKIPVAINGDDVLLATPDFKKIITGGYSSADLFAKIWDATSRRQTLKLGGKELVNNVGDDLFLLQGSLRGTVIAASNSVVAAVLNTAFYNNFQLGSINDKSARLWNINTGKEIASLTGHNHSINYIGFSPDGKKIITASDDKTVKIWDASTGALLTDFKGHTFKSRFALFQQPEQKIESGGQLFTASDDGTVKLWNMTTAAMQQSFKCLDGDIFSLQFNHDTTKLIVASRYGMVSVVDMQTGIVTAVVSKPTYSLDPTVDDPVINYITGLLPPELSRDGTRLLHAIHTSKAAVLDAKTGKLLFTVNDSGFMRLHFAHFSDKGDKIITGWIPESPGKNKKLVVDVWDAFNGRHLFKVKTGSDELIDAFFADNDTKIVALSNSGPLVTISNAADGTLLQQWKADAPWSEGISISNDKQTILISSHQDAVRLFNTFSGELLMGLDAVDNLASAVKLGPDNSLLSMIKKDYTAEIWSVKEKKKISVLKGHTDEIFFATIEPGNKRVVTGAADNTIKVWDINSGQCLYSFFGVDSSDYINLLPSGYYSATGTAAKQLHYVTEDLKTVSFEQLDVKYNRPDKILDAAGIPDTVLRNAYKRAYLKRIQQLGVDTAFFTDDNITPEADFVNRSAISYQQKNEQLLLKITAKDSANTLSRFNLWVNEVPVFGTKGINLASRFANTFDTTIQVNLSTGDNRIETSVTNKSGVESYRKPLLVNYSPVLSTAGKTYFVGIGINHFADSSHNLKWCIKDIQSLTKKLKSKYGSQFVLVDTLFDQRFSLANLNVVKQKLLATGVNDKVIVSYSGHGLLSKERDYFLSTYTTDFKNPVAGGIPYEELEKLMDAIPARKKILLLDACNSGEVDKESKQIVNSNSNQSADNGGTRGGEVSIEGGSGSDEGRKSSFELMQSLFVNVRKGTGAVIIAASGGEQSALEDNSLGNGMFTYSILEAMEKFRRVKISELKKYIGRRVLELSGGRQKPTTRNEPIAFDWEVW